MRVIDEEALRKQVTDFPDLTQKERAAHFGVSEFCIGYGLRKLGITQKKRHSGINNAVMKTSNLSARTHSERSSGQVYCYLDECGFCAESFRPYAYAPKGEPTFGLVSSQRNRKTTMVAARIEDTFTAFSLFEGSCNAERFNTWVRDQLCPKLSSKHLVIMDNARIHKTELTRELIEACGAELLFLPPYSPDYNPIEHDFANIKRLREYKADIPLNEVINMYHNF